MGLFLWLRLFWVFCFSWSQTAVKNFQLNCFKKLRNFQERNAVEKTSCRSNNKYMNVWICSSIVSIIYWTSLSIFQRNCENSLFCEIFKIARANIYHFVVHLSPMNIVIAWTRGLHSLPMPAVEKKSAKHYSEKH